MSAEYALILGGLGLGLTLTWAIWSEARVWILKSDALRIRADLLEAIKSSHSERRQHSIVAQAFVNTVIRRAEILSLPPAIYLFPKVRDEALRILIPDYGRACRSLMGTDEVSQDQVPPEVARAFIRLLVVVLAHQLTTITGPLTVFVLVVWFGKAKLTESLADLFLALRKPQLLAEKFLHAAPGASKPVSS